MINKLWHVLSTYLHRKSLWFAALVYVLFMIAAWNMPVRETPRLWMESQVTWLPKQEFDGVSAFLQWSATAQELEELKSLTIHGNYAITSDKLGEDGKPLHELKHDANASREFLQKLTQCIHLRELHLLSFDMTPELGQAIARLASLDRLELTLNGRPIPSMADLPSLNQLRYFQVPHVPVSELGLLAKHPQLKTIELQDWPTTSIDSTAAVWREPSTLHQATQIEQVILKPINRLTWSMMQFELRPMSPDESNEAMPFNQALIDSLAQLPQLHAVEVRDPWGGWPARTIESQQVIKALAGRSDINVNPVVRSTESITNPFGFVATLTVIAIVLTQLFDHFGAGISRTVPGFAAPHFIVAGGLLLLQLLIAAALLVSRHQLAWLPAIAICAAVPAVVAIAVGWVTRHPRSLPLMFAFGIWTVLGFVFASGALLKWMGGDDFLYASNTSMLGTSMLLVAIEFAGLAWAAAGIHQLSLQLEEANLPAGLGILQTIKQMQLQKVGQANATGVKRTPAWRLLDQKLDAFLQERPQFDEASYRRRQWHAANVGNWKATLLGCAIAPWALLGIFCLTFGVISGQYTSLHSYTFYCLAAGTFCWVMYAVIVSSYQLMRRPVYEQELLRPMWRHELNQRLEESPLVMSWPALAASLVYMVIYTIYSQNDLPEDGVSQAMAAMRVPHLLLAVTCPLPLLANSTLLVTIASEFWRGVIAFAIQFSLFMFVQMFLITRLFNQSVSMQATSAVVYIVVVVCVGLAMLIQWRVHKRLAKMQWGLVSG